MFNMNDPKSMAMLQAAASMLQSSGYSARPISTGEAMGNALQGGLQGYMQGSALQRQNQLLDMETKTMEAQQSALVRKLASEQKLQEIFSKGVEKNLTMREMGQEAMRTGDPLIINMVKGLMPKVKSTQKGFDAEGKPALHNIYDDGSIESTGVRPAEKMSFQNLGAQTVGIDPFTGQPMAQFQNSMAPGEGQRLALAQASHGLAQQNAAMQQQQNQFMREKALLEMSPEYQAQRAAAVSGARETAQIQAKGAADLPNAIVQGETTIGLVDDLLKHPGFKLSVGKSAPIGKIQSMVPGTDAASFDIAMKQLQGKQFLEAFESLKGGGQITQIEGEKATQAMSRMNVANTEEEFTKAAREFQQIIRNGTNRARLRAGQQPVQAPAAPAMDNGGFSIRRID